MKTSGGWSTEYPEAKIFISEQEALEFLNERRSRVSNLRMPWTRRLGLARIIENYGRVDERDCGHQVVKEVRSNNR